MPAWNWKGPDVQTLLKNAIDHPWTTVAGLLGAALTLYAGGLDPQHALIAAVVTAAGAAVKDPHS